MDVLPMTKANQEIITSLATNEKAIIYLVGAAVQIAYVASDDDLNHSIKVVGG